MRTALILLLAAVLVGCNSGTTPPSTSTSTPAAAPAQMSAPAATPGSTGEVQKKLQEVAGTSATNCGEIKSLSGDDLIKASDCALTNAKEKKPFLVSYEMPGMSVGVAGNAEGKLFTVQSEGENGKPAPPKMQACPAELRLAQSGRVTCMPASSMGAMPGTASPHGGGMATPPAGTPNPHQEKPKPQKSH